MVRFVAGIGYIFETSAGCRATSPGHEIAHNIIHHKRLNSYFYRWLELEDGFCYLSTEPSKLFQVFKLW